MTRTGDLTPEQAWELLSSDPAAVLVDVRTHAEWSFVGVPDLSSIEKSVVLDQWTTYPGGEPNPAFLSDLAGIDRKAPLLFLCRSGQRSMGAADAAAAAGFSRTYNVLDGFEGPTAGGHRGVRGWRAQGLPWVQS